ncbi:MAG: ComF family protein [Candidatus Margulisiibacteriota bacterium]
MIKPLLDLIFPPKCEVCRRPGRDALCPACFGQIKFLNPQLGVYSAAVYDGALKEAIHRFKFNKRKNLAEPLGVLLVQYVSQAPGLKMAEVEAIIPVPLHHKRRRERGFNQAELLAKVVGRYYDKPVINALERQKNTHAQFDLPRDARFANIREAFRVSVPRSVHNRKVMLLDDIYTTGSTVGECVRALKTAGAKRIEILTLSRAVE